MIAGGCRLPECSLRHPERLLVVRRDGSSVAYPAFRVGQFATGDGEVVAAYNLKLVRVTSTRLVPLLTSVELAKALKVPSTSIADIYAPAVDAHGDIYFVTSIIHRRACENRILERTRGGSIHQLSAAHSTTCA